jgi:hypothetical protein
MGIWWLLAVSYIDSILPPICNLKQYNLLAVLSSGVLLIGNAGLTATLTPRLLSCCLT